MKKLNSGYRNFFMIITILMGTTTVYTFADGHINTGTYEYDTTRTVTYSKRHCWQGYKRLKRTLKNEAKEVCRSNGVTRSNKLIMTKWNKYRCTKAHGSNGRTVRVKARFRAMCNY